MLTNFHGKRITSMLGILPETIGKFDDEVDYYSFPPKQTLRLKKLMGFEQHMLAKESTTVSDLAWYGLQHMLKNDWIKSEEIGAIVVVTLCPDHFVPHISNMLQAKMGLGTDIVCMDIAQGCCGFLLGLFQSFMLLEHMDKKVILVNGDVLSHKVSKRDRNDFPLIGDAVSVTVVENGGDDSIAYEMHCDGTRGDALKIPAGGFRMPCTPETAKMIDQGDGNFRAADHMHMDGTAVFNFVQQEVPPMLANAFARNNLTVDDPDLFLFHQPNKFMLKKLAAKIGIDEKKLPMNLVENFGNSSGACIPITAVYNLSDELCKNEYLCCLAAFGSGLAWGNIIMHVGNMEHCELLYSDL